MAPGRRRGSTKAAAAAAAARQQWKVGDLVLAKMKGFPAWPAMISDPVKWGYSSGQKKLLVYFYGTKQIAFCNHVDIEAFTDEKKNSLLTKRQGKGADFVRAVDEIIGIYEKLKSSDHYDNCSGDGGIVPDNLEGCGNNISSEMPHAHISGYASVDGFIKSGDVSTALIEENFCNMNVVVDRTSDAVVVEELCQASLTSSAATRRRPLDAPLQSCAMQSRLPSLPRSGSYLIVEQCELHKSTESFRADEACAAVVDDIGCEESLSRKRKCKEECSISIPHAVVSSSEGLTLNGNSGVDIATHVSEAISPEEQGSLESNCETNFQSGFVEQDALMNIELEPLQRTVVFKKKRKPNRNRFSSASDYPASAGNLNVQVEQKDSVVALLSFCKDINESSQQADGDVDGDGDEHLPLVKRARVRKGESLAEASEDLAINKCDISCKYASAESSSHSDATAGPIKEASSRSSPNTCTSGGENDMKCTYLLNNISKDIEAALPPSKRLHRALEAMSANAADVSNTGELVPNGSLDSLKDCSYHISFSENVGKASESLNVDTSVGGRPLSTMSKLSPCLDTKILEKQLHSSSELDNNICEEVHINDDKCDGNNNNDDIEVACTKNFKVHPSVCGKKQIEHRNDAQPMNRNEVSSSGVVCDEGFLSRSSLPLLNVHRDVGQSMNECANSRVLQDSVVVGSSETFLGKLNSKRAGNLFLPNDSTLVLSSSDVDSAQATESRKPLGNHHSGLNIVERSMQDVADVVLQNYATDTQNLQDGMVPMKISIAAAQPKQPVSASFSISHNVEKSISDSSVCNNMEHSSERESSLNSAISSIPAIEDSSNILNVGCRSPYAVMRQNSFDKPEVYSEANIPRKSFEAALYTLSRAKESIGRATRLAIECAKFGIAAEAVDLLLKHLEKETNLHKRIDLFFLVDSICRYSRAQRGGFGDLYPSFIESVLSRILSAAAPPGPAAWENRKQCLKVLNLWLERKTLPQSVIAHHIREIEFLNEMPISNQASGRSSRTERAFNDPVREMEGMLVDEYGSNAGFQMTGLLVPRAFVDDGEDSSSDEKDFESVTPERRKSGSDDDDAVIANGSLYKHRHVLEDVDGELEMEDVSPCVERLSPQNVTGLESSCSTQNHGQGKSLPFVPPLPDELPPLPPPLPSSPPVASPLPAIDQNGLTAKGSHLYTSKNENIQKHVPSSTCQRTSMVTASSEQSNPAPYYAHESEELRKQMQQPGPSSLSCSSSYCGPRTHRTPRSGNNLDSDTTSAVPAEFYALPPPPPPPPSFSNQFSFGQDLQADGPRKPQPRGNSSFMNGSRFVHDSQEAKYCTDRDTSRLVRQDFEEARYSPRNRSDYLHPGKFRPFYGPAPRPMSNPCQRWPLPPRAYNPRSSYSTRPPPCPPISRIDRGHSLWRPR